MSGLAEDEHEPAGDVSGGEEVAAAPAGMPTVDDLMEVLRAIKVGELLVSTIGTLASIAFGRLESRDFPEAKLAIEAIRALLPLLQGQAEDELRGSLQQALTDLQVAYADAVASAE